MKPNIAVSIEPSTAGGVAFSPLAAWTSNAADNGQFALLLQITNSEPKDIELRSIEAVFTPPPSVSNRLLTRVATITPGGTLRVTFEQNEYVIVPRPAPAQVNLRIECRDFDVWEQNYVLQAYTSSAPDGYDFPGNITDLAPGEYWSGDSAFHGAGGGNQLFAHDLGVVSFVFDPATGQGAWSDFYPMVDGTKNEDFRIFGKPIYAMADGKVLEVRKDVEDNPGPHRETGRGGGNVLFIQHGTEQAIFAHLKFGSSISVNCWGTCETRRIDRPRR